MLQMYAEIYKDGVWQKIGAVFESALDELKINKQLTDRPYDGRDKMLFEVLTGQTCKQNKIYSEIPHISSVTGIPHDASKELCDKFVRSGKNCIKYISLADLLAFNWQAKIYRRGFITEWQYKRLKEKNITPSYICNDGVGDCDKVTPFEMDMILQNDNLRTSGASYYILYEYAPKCISTYCEFFCEKTIPALINLLSSADNATANNIRIIYFYNQ